MGFFEPITDRADWAEVATLISLALVAGRLALTGLRRSLAYGRGRSRKVPSILWRRLDRMDRYAADPVRLWSFAVSISLTFVPAVVVIFMVFSYQMPWALAEAAMNIVAAAFLVLMAWFVGWMSDFFDRIADPAAEYERLRERIARRLARAQDREERAELEALDAELRRRLARERSGFGSGRSGRSAAC